MTLSRRDLLRVGGGAAAAVTAFGFDLGEARAAARSLKIERTTETRSTCPYCSVSCGVVIHTLGDGAKNVKRTVVHVEGDPDHPINRGTLCPKGASLEQDIVNDGRLTHPQVREPGTDTWKTLSWDEAIARIARRIKDVRDRTFVAHDDRDRVVNRTGGLAVIGGCTDTNELNYLLVKSARSLGVTYIENQARI